MFNPPIPLRSVVPFTLAFLAAWNGVVGAGEQPTVEVFATAEFPFDASLETATVSRTVRVYEIDGVDRFEEDLSSGLSADADIARGEALERIGRLTEGHLQRVRRVALGLSKAVQYGIDRYPAIVLDGEAVIYGVTDVEEAVRLYRRWQEASGR